MPKKTQHRRRLRGQSLLELALSLTVMLIIFGGLVEIGFLIGQYSLLVQAARNGARYAIDFEHTDIEPACTPVRTPACTDAVCVRDFYCATANTVERNLSYLGDTSTPLDPTRDDIIVSVFTIRRGVGVVIRYPTPYGWSYYGNERSQFTNSDVERLIAERGLSYMDMGAVLVEIVYYYHHRLGLPWMTPFIPNPKRLHVYSFMPQDSAAPTTPTP